MTDKEKSNLKNEPSNAPADDEERRIRERLKARSAARQKTGDRSEDRRSEDRRSDDHRSEERRSEERRIEDRRDHSRPRDNRRDYRRAGRGGRGPPPPRHRNQDRYRPYPHDAPRRYSIDAEEDDFGRRRRSSPPEPRGRPRSHSGSSPSYSSGERGRSRKRSHSRRRSRSRSVSSHSYSSHSSSDSSRSSSSSSASSAASAGGAGKEGRAEDPQAALYSKDQRTVFVQQLVQRTTERDLRKFFRKQELKVNEVILLRDKRTGRHKGSAYVELRKISDVPKAVALSNQVPSFQRFPILVKASEAEKNYLQTGTASTAPLTAAQVVKSGNLPVSTNVVAKPPPLIHPSTGKLLESQKVYIGSLDPSVTQEHLFLLYSQFGYLDKVALQIDTGTGISKGFAFLSFHDPKDANLAIQTMSGQVLAGRPMKTGWAVNQIPSIPGSEIVMSDEFPVDASVRTTNAYGVLAKLTMGVGLAQIRQGLESGDTPAVAAPLASTASRVPTVADARASLAASVAKVVATPTIPAVVANAIVQTPAGQKDSKDIGRAQNPSPHILVHNMYDKDEETVPGWEMEIKEDFVDECSQFGKILGVKVMSQEPGGKIYASFESADGAQKCASSIAGRWFNKRQLRVEFVSMEEIPS